ncbi:anthranilate phosphoribosyltransferase [Ruminiclostridium herbifermentans]|uniref:Anthranilate phosphoribosyltransferase n=1 Tax=Ruminiclostridium herbifermentans TaxID=2488810 RepID=A0A4U7JM11_9FIRM|nr:anthranilate phosphoribosyltransferase [Ruminiclostridium herbifermentans]QNU66232.1 anthranilate phosphoribosyltransferase [Ruminiclostridium herbifermentans]
MIKEAIKRVTAHENLTEEMAEAVMHEILSGEATQCLSASFLTAMATKGETIEEITWSALGMRKHCIRLLQENEIETDVLEIAGTGGDNSQSFNISSTVAIVVSAAGIPVAKPGSRANSSRSGTADVFEALGVNIDMPPERSLALLQSIGLCFLLAQKYAPAMKYVAPVRKEIGIRTIFNILGPLVSPAGAKKVLLGVYDGGLVEPIAKVLANLGVQNVLVVYGQDGLDEVSIGAPTSVCEVRSGLLKTYEITPEQFGLRRASKQEILGGTPAENAEITRAILAGEQGARRDIVLLNSAAAIYVARPNLTLSQCMEVARNAIDSGKAAQQLDRFIKLSRMV